ncbi:hypothetical protein B0H17DRAFT_1205111 [Mycena rosella]|uniref:G domain-containing protein n=1 Tax=Mycena rosella TaxID=1033263 RepID=A0AAD7D7S2_MYCRO|nr:hypothetical protein B0H17DRAFT_1205111 [Mycena rosella]
MSEPLVPETERILRDCPQFRVLVVGKSGAGKSSLIGHTFGVDVKSVSTDQRGKCSINTEILSPQNSRFVLHDSMGFEPGNVENLQDVKNFISERSRARVTLKECLHAIWLCIQVPYAGGRALETGDEEVVEFALTHKVPVVVVFTQHDRLLSMINVELPKPGRTPEEIYKLCAEDARPIFQERCLVPLEQLSVKLNVELRWVCTSGLASKKHPNPDREALYDLVKTTCDLVQKDMGVDASMVYGMAQRASAELKIKTSVEVGMKRYWAGLASSAHFPGWTLLECLETVHKEITATWNFYDPQDDLINNEFSDQVKKIAQLATPDESEAKSWFNSEDREAAETWIGFFGATVAANAGLIIGTLGVTAWFGKFVLNVYRNTPETLRCFMAYLIDLTLVLHELFYVLPTTSPRTVTKENITEAFKRYSDSDLGRVHSEVRRYVAAQDLKQHRPRRTSK